jgi:muramoyltetrapeptide carboxypeptidase
MDRKKFIKTISTATIGSTLLSSSSYSPEKSELKSKLNELPVIKPPKLKRGDTLALITPGSYIKEDEKQDSIKNLKELGFEVTYSDRLMEKNGYFSATDEERAADINEMFEREDIHGIVCARGGYGCARILPFLDYQMIRANPKPFIGFSDVTALHYAILKKGGLVTFNGAVGISTFSRFTVQYFEKVLLYPEDNLEMENSSTDNNYNSYGITTITDGKANGELIGGNLSIVVSLIGTEYDIDTEGKIIFLEEFIEEPYRIDRMLTQMIQAGKFERAAGIALGVFKMCEPSKTNPAFEDSFSLMEVLRDRLGNLKIPVIYGLSFGHVVDKLTIPFGIRAELDTDRQLIKLLERAVT